MDEDYSVPLSARPFNFVIDADLGRWSRSYHNWHLSSEGPAAVGVTEIKLVRAVHDCDDGGYRDFWADSYEEACRYIDEMPNHGDYPDDYT